MHNFNPGNVPGRQWQPNNANAEGREGERRKEVSGVGIMCWEGRHEGEEQRHERCTRTRGGRNEGDFSGWNDMGEGKNRRQEDGKWVIHEDSLEVRKICWEGRTQEGRGDSTRQRDVKGTTPRKS